MHTHTHTQPKKLTAEIYVKKLQNLNFDVERMSDQYDIIYLMY